MTLTPKYRIVGQLGFDAPSPDMKVRLAPFIAAIATSDGSNGFGYYFASHGGGDQVVSNVASQAVIDSASAVDRLKGPFLGASLLDPVGVFTPRAVDDVYRLIFRVTAVPSALNTDLTVQLDIGGSFGVIETDRRRLALGAGVHHQETFIFPPFTGATFITNGGRFLWQADDDVTITSVDLRIFPESAA